MAEADFDYIGDTAIITGSTKGIGLGIAKGLAKAGANVVINARTAADVEETAANLNANSDGEVVGIAGDVSDPNDVEALIEDTIDIFGGVDILVNNAAVWPARPMPEVGLEDWDHGLNVNARGAFYTSTVVARHMIETERDGAIVNVTSQAGERHGGSHGLYGISKAAQNGLTWRMAHDLAKHDIRVNAISTAQTDSYQLRKGYIDGKSPEELTEAEIKTAKEAMGKDIPLGRVGEPEDIAKGVLFLASDAASYVTGHILRISGGKNLE